MPAVEKYGNNKGDRQLRPPPSVNNEASACRFQPLRWGFYLASQPEATRQAGKRFYNHTFLSNAKVREATVYDVDKGGDNAEGTDAGSKGSEEQSVEGNA